MIEIDSRNCLVDRRTSFINEQYQLPTIHQVQYLDLDHGRDYYFSMDKEVVSAAGRVVSQSNSKASFSKGLDGRGELLVFGKYHNAHSKYSLNWMEIGRDKKIL